MYDSGFGTAGVSMRDAYAAIHDWVRSHVDDPDTPTGLGERSRALVAAMPQVEDATEVEMRAVFGELIGGNLAWAYRKTDGTHRMAEYAHEALRCAGVSHEISDPAEREALLASPMRPYLFCSRLWC
jgi:hypothetical protein